VSVRKRTTSGSRLLRAGGAGARPHRLGDDQLDEPRGAAVGRERMLGTKPDRDCVSRLEEPPIVIDLATCAVAYGKVEMAHRRGESIPSGWADRPRRQVTTSPQAMMDGGVPLLPLGSDRERSGHKAMRWRPWCDVLSAVLSGANWGPYTPPFALRQEIPARSVGKGIGHFFGSAPHRRLHRFPSIQAPDRRLDPYLPRHAAGAGTSGPLIPGGPGASARSGSGQDRDPAGARGRRRAARHRGPAPRIRFD